MKRYTTLLIAILMILILCACNGDSQPTGDGLRKEVISIKNEEEIANDLQTKQSEIGLADTFSLSSIEILDRQTDTEAEYKTDIVYVTATFEGNTCTIYRSFILSYGTYEDSWNLDSVDDYNAGELSCAVKALPDASLVDAYFSDYNATFEGLPAAQYTDWEITNPGDYNFSTTVTCLAKAELNDALYGAVASATFIVDIPFELDIEGDCWCCYSSALPKAEDAEIISIDISPKGNWLARDGDTCTINGITWDGKTGTLDAHATCDEYEFSDFFIDSTYVSDDFFSISGTCTKYWDGGSEEMTDLHWDIAIEGTGSRMDICRYSYGSAVSYYAPID